MSAINPSAEGARVVQSEPVQVGSENGIFECLLNLRSAALTAAFDAIPQSQIQFRDSESARFERIEELIDRRVKSNGVQVSYEPDLDTIIRHSPRGRVPDFRPEGPGAHKGTVPQPSEVILPMFAGAGGRSSHSGSLEVPVKVFTAPLTPAKKGFAAKLRNPEENPHYRRMGAEAVEWIAQLNGPAPHQFDLETGLEWIHQYVLSLKEMVPDVPIIPVARSAAAGLLMAYHHKYPGHLDGLIVVGPLHPRVGYEQNTQDFFKSIVEGDRELQMDSFQWVNSAYEEMSWPEVENAMGDLPILAIFGARDPQSSIEVREEFQRLASFNDLSRVDVVPGGHFLFGGSNPEDGKATYLSIYQFVDSVLKSRSQI